MEIKLSREGLLDALMVGGSMAGRSKTIAILDCAKCTVTSGRMVISSFDTETAVMRHFPIISSDVDGFFCVNPRDLISVLRSLKDEVVTLKVDELICVIEHSRGVLELPVLPSEDFPEIHRDEDAYKFSSDKCEEFVAWLKKAKDFVGNDKIRPIFSGVYIYLNNGELGVASSNIVTMFTNSTKCEENDENVDVVLSTKAISTLIEILNGVEKLNVAFGKTNVVFTTPNSKISCRMIEGKYPNIKQVIPTSDNISVKIAKSDLVASLERAIFSANEGSCQLALKIEDGNMSIDSQNLTSSKKTHEECPCELEGDNILIGVNGNCFLTCVSAIDAEYIRLGMTKNNRPIVFHDDENDRQDIIMMPMVLRN